jgi:dihydrofolate synthase/folylpolyglutamate synthase
MNLEAWLALLEQRHPQTIELGLDRCGEVYRRLGKPRPGKQVFTVAGTNGKGSTVAYLDALAGAMGQRRGTYTSPHIFRFNERVCVMGQAVTDQNLVRAFEQVEAARGDVSLTYFEFTTLAALLIMQQADLDCAILEVGLGGRLDAVNLVDTDCAVITPIGLDHQDYLGPDLDSIAAEKAGIIRAGKPAVCTETEPPAPVTATAERLGAPVYRRGNGFDLQQTAECDRYLQFTQGEKGLPVPPPPMPGVYQLDNLAAALCAYSLLNPGCFDRQQVLSDAIRNTRLPGRLQQVGTAPEIFLDVGHNPLAAEAVAAFLTGRGQKGTGTVCVLAMLADKPAGDVALALGACCQRWLCAGLPGERGQTGEVLARRVQAVLPGADVRSVNTVGDAMRIALNEQEGVDRVLVFGSFVTIAAAGDWLRKSMGRTSVLSHN